MTAKAFYLDEAWKFTADAKLFALNTPFEGYDYIIVSAVVAPFVGPKVHIFGANRHGDRLSNHSLPGSQEGTLSHGTALLETGYEPTGNFSLDIDRALTIIEFVLNTTDDPRKQSILERQIIEMRQYKHPGT